MVRPYFNKSITELEALHAAAPNDTALAALLSAELDHRSTARAAALLRRLKARLTIPDSDAERPAMGERPIVGTSAVRPTPSTDDPPRPPELENDPAAILSCWSTLEALSPQTYRRPVDLASGADARSVVNLNIGQLPWERGEKSRLNQQLYYQVVLGAIPMDRATDALIKSFGNDEEIGRREREKAAIAAVMLDRNGVLLEENGVALSSFAWALPIALRGNLTTLSDWLRAERALVDSLSQRLRRSNDAGSGIPLTLDSITGAFRWLQTALNLPDDLVEVPSFALRVYHYYKAKNPPEPLLLNSFFLADLGRASKLIQSGLAGKALTRYVGASKVEHGQDLLTDRAELERLLSPLKFPEARWPSPGGHPLVALQQAAVNAVRAELGGKATGIAAVNGPPGTGKTTLLRDVVAGCVMDRARAMVNFADPMAAFTASGQKIAAGDSAFLHLYRLDDTLKGHEVLIASSNNKAVENVSKELPAAKAVGRKLSYFRTVSDRLLSIKLADGEITPGEPSWGLIAAVLGNALNRAAFQQAVWWDDDQSLRLYLKAAKGDSVVREIKDAEGRVISRHVPRVVEEEKPPTPEQAKANWRGLRGRFKALDTQLGEDLRRLEKVREVCLQLPPARRTLDATKHKHQEAIRLQQKADQETANAHTAQEAAQGVLDAAARAERTLHQARPGWFARLLRTTRFREWSAIYEPALSRRNTAARQLSAAMDAHHHMQAAGRTAALATQEANDRVARAAQSVAELEARIAPYRAELGERIVDEEFFEQGHSEWNLTAPWITDEIHAKREQLFAAALEVHKAFIDVTAQKVMHNLGVLMGAMQAGAFKDDAKKALLGDLWSTLFMVVPALSTTFASVDRMLGDVPTESFGWLLIDEAGQATPQAAVGALMRARRAIVVGDPLQIPPVSSLPARLTHQVCNFFKVTPAQWAAPAASVQTLADDASHHRAEFKTGDGVRQVGLPLLVHRRCKDPMFQISNRIAYDGQMVFAAGAPRRTAIGEVLGESGWFDVDGDAADKWCAAEGQLVVRLLSELARAGIREPDVYIISPFRVVADEMRRLLATQDALLTTLGVDAEDWIRNRVGTIHTFQGKEAEAVIAVLGAPMASQQGARNWACSTPNILNVMVSRAKASLYVVGSRAAWAHVGHAQTLAELLPISTRRHQAPGASDRKI